MSHQRVLQLLAEADVLWDQARTLTKTARMEPQVADDDDLRALSGLMTANAANHRALAELQNAMADRYDEIAHILRA